MNVRRSLRDPKKKTNGNKGKSATVLLIPECSLSRSVYPRLDAQPENVLRPPKDRENQTPDDPEDAARPTPALPIINKSIKKTCPAALGNEGHSSRNHQPASPPIPRPTALAPMGTAPRLSDPLTGPSAPSRAAPSPPSPATAPSLRPPAPVASAAPAPPRRRPPRARAAPVRA